MGKTTKSGRPEWADRITALRRHAELTQSGLGKHLNCSAMAVSRWERGQQEPPANVYIQLGNITGDPECWYFWARAGLHSVDLMRVLPAARSRLRRDPLPGLQVIHAGAHPIKKGANGLVAIPVLPITASAHGGKGDPELAFDQVRRSQFMVSKSCLHQLPESSRTVDDAYSP